MKKSILIKDKSAVNLIDENLPLSGYDSMYVMGGYIKDGQGCPPWGSVNPKELLYLKDELGSIKLLCETRTFNIPLVLGYTTFLEQYCDYKNMSPFADKLKDVFIKALHVLDIDGKHVIKINIKGLKIKSIKISNNPKKPFDADFNELLFTTDNDDIFLDKFARHTIKPNAPYPKRIKQCLNTLYNACYTVIDEQNSLPLPNIISNNYAKLTFTGNKIAEIASRVYSESISDMVAKLDDSGAFNASSPQSPAFYYDGFAGYRDNVGTYSTMFYSRDLGIGVNGLCDFTDLDLSKLLSRVIEGIKYFKNNNLSFNNKPILAHFPVVISSPLYYSNELVKYGWDTEFTYERFGEHHKNLGNLETDGHGLSMLAIIKLWTKCGGVIKWWAENSEILAELADFNIQLLDSDNFGITRSENDTLDVKKCNTLYAESESGMKDNTLYCNIPNLIAFKEWSEIFAQLGDKLCSERFFKAYERLKKGIETDFICEMDGKKVWNMYKIGFYHDCVQKMYFDFYGSGYEEKLEEGWKEISLNTFAYDLKFNEYCVNRPFNSRHAGNNAISLESACKLPIASGKSFGAKATGYDHCNILSSALLCDKVDEYNEYFCNLMKICYSPKLPQPYLPPEGFSFNGDAFRRQGDLGNLAQEGEVINVFRQIIGLGCIYGRVTFYPRNVNSSDISFENVNLNICGKQVKVSGFSSAPTKSGQTLTLKFDNDVSGVITFRFGGFAKENIDCKLSEGIVKKVDNINGMNYIYVETLLKKEVTVNIKIN